MRSATLRLQTREARRKLALREEPYWFEIRRGLSIGYRRGSEGGSWLLREFKPDSSHKNGGRYVKRRLGLPDDHLPADGTTVLSWSDAQKVALDSERPTVTRPGKHTVAAAWDAYKSTRATPVDAREQSIWTRFIEPALGSKEVAELTTHELKKWRNDQVSLRGNRGQSKGAADEADLLRRARYTANRRWTVLRAILNDSYNSDLVRSDDAWRKVEPFANVDRPRTVTATAEQARRLLGVITDPLLGLAAGSLYTGLRLSELHRLRPDDVDRAAARLRVRHGKGGKERWIPLTREGRDFFAGRIQDKPQDTPIFAPMSYSDVSKAMRAASEAAKIEPRVTMHDLRRSYGSLLLNSGAPIEVIQELLGHSDSRMTRRTYAHLLQKTVANTVRKHLPSFSGESTKRRKSRKVG
jgi:integrase